VDETVLQSLDALSPLAPLHQPHNLEPIHVIRRRLPDIPQVACFDTAFHRTQPEIARMFALPQSMLERGVKRYGFHGLSYDYIASVLADYDAHLPSQRVVVAHLGNGASLCALKGGVSVATTIGFSALDGLPMGTRCGALGENDAMTRAEVVAQLEWAGLRLDETANRAGGPKISSGDEASAWVIPTSEELVIVRQMQGVLPAMQAQLAS
jgi:acetate kinase